MYRHSYRWSLWLRPEGRRSASYTGGFLVDGGKESKESPLFVSQGRETKEEEEEEEKPWKTQQKEVIDGSQTPDGSIDAPIWVYVYTAHRMQSCIPMYAQASMHTWKRRILLPDASLGSPWSCVGPFLQCAVDKEMIVCMREKKELSCRP